MADETAVEVSKQANQLRNEMILGGSDISHLPLVERVELLKRLDEAQTAETFDDYIGVELIVDGLTVYVRPGEDLEGNPAMFQYVAFQIRDVGMIRTASSQAFPHVLQIASILGYDMQSGKLPHPYKMLVKRQRATQGSIYKFQFLDLAEIL